MDAGVQPSLHTNFHHQIVYEKSNLKIQYPLPYEREVVSFPGNNMCDPGDFNILLIRM